MTTNSIPLSPWAEVEKQVLRAERQIKEERHIATVHKLGIVLTIVGFGALVILIVGILSDREQWEPWRAVVSPLAHLVGIGGMVMVAAAWVTGSQRQRCDSMVRHHAHHHHREGAGTDHADHHEQNNQGRSMHRRTRRRKPAADETDQMPEEPKRSNGNDVTGTIIAMPNKKIYELGIHEGERRERERRRKDDPPN